MSSVVDVKLLKTMHRVLRQQTDLNGRIRRGPARVNIAKNAEATFDAALIETKELLKQTRLSAEKKQLQLQSREAKVADLSKRLNAVDSNREYQLLKDQIEAEEQANSVQADEIFELLEKVDVIENEVVVAESNLVKAQAETAKVQKTVDAELASLNGDLSLVESELDQCVKQLPGEIRKEYDRLVESLGEDALAGVQENSCGHCYTQLTTQHISDLMMKRTMFCKNCGSLLYLTEDPTI